MSSMEIDLPTPINGLSEQPTHVDVLKHRVQFSEHDEVKVISSIEMRPKHKARRRARIPKLQVEQDLQNGEQSPTKPISPARLKKISEKDRHSRTGRRGLPKKGGAGGKGTWGKLTEMYEGDGHTHDSNDPNYNSEDEVATYVVSPSSPQLGEEDFQKQGEGIFKEYFDHGDTQEVAASLEEYNIHNFRHEVVRLLITMAMEERAAHRELASVLLSDLYGHVLNSRDIATGFDLLLSQLGDLALDTPDAPEVLGNFIARCVADDCLPPAYVTNHTNGTDPKPLGALKRAQLLLSMKHGMARLDNVWGVGGGQRPVMFLIGKMNLLLKEFLSSGDQNEAVRCLRELEVPHFHHEVVYEAVVLAIEDDNERCSEMICSLLLHMFQSGLIPREQLDRGFLRVFSDITDIVLDIPNAYHALGKFIDRAATVGLVSPLVAEQVPQRGRKRFVSEGDGGAIKAPED